MSSFYPLATTTWDAAELQAMQRVIDSGNFSMGKEVGDFESAFAAAMGSRYCVMVNSGSSANLLMVAACCFTQEPLLRAGDEVIVPAVSWSTTYYPFQQYGLRLQFVDVDPRTLNIDIDQVETAITSRTRAICAVNLLGNPCDLPRLKTLCETHGLLLLEDNCESMGADIAGRKAGTYGLLGSFSSFFSHHISTMEGGLIVTDNEEIHHILLALRAHGWTRNLPEMNLVTGRKSSDPFEESFRFVLPGYNLRPLELSGALGVEQLKKLPALVAGRRSNAKFFQDLLAGHPAVDIQQENGESSWFGFSLLLKGKRERGALLAELASQGIEYRPIVAGNFVKNPVIRHIDHSVHGDLPIANRIDQQGLFVGNHHYDIRPQLERLKSCLDKFSSSST